MTTRLAVLAAAALLAAAVQPAAAAPMPADLARDAALPAIPAQSGYNAQGAFGGGVSGTRTSPGNVTRQSSGANGGSATVNRQVGPNGGSRTATRTGPGGRQSTCTTNVTRGTGNRAGNTTCIGPDGRTYTGGSNLTRNADGSISGTATGPRGGGATVNSAPRPAQ